MDKIGFGCMSLEGRQIDSIKILRQAYHNDIKFFDTADLYDYGENEKIVGEALAPFRDKVQVTTKVGNEWNETRTHWRWNPTKDYILKAAEKSLKRLRTDYIDLYMLHGGTLDDPIDETIEAFEFLKEQGKILEYGISSIRPNVIREWIKRSHMGTVMMQYSLLDRRPEEECLDLLNKSDISVITRGTLAKGMLIGKPAKEYLGYSEQEVKLMQEAVSKTENPISTSLQYVNKHPAVKTAVIGIRTLEQLNELISSAYISTSEDTLKNLSKVLAPNIYKKHR